jgi:hypothetical protein
MEKTKLEHKGLEIKTLYVVNNVSRKRYKTVSLLIYQNTNIAQTQA